MSITKTSSAVSRKRRMRSGKSSAKAQSRDRDSLTIESRSSAFKPYSLSAQRQSAQTSDHQSSNQKFLMDQIQRLTEEEEKLRAQSQNPTARKKVVSRFTPKKALLHKKKMFPVTIDPIQMEFNNIKKDIGSEFKKVQTIAHSIREIEQQSANNKKTIAESFDQRE